MVKDYQQYQISTKLVTQITYVIHLMIMFLLC